MAELLSEASPRLKARFAGLFQLLEGMTAVFGQIYLLGIFVVARDPAATVTNITGKRILISDWICILPDRCRVSSRTDAFHL